ncbi:fasciclin-2-like isoform X2 [Anthonomus grandis grandis]|uniref:fasciclin-2-like isoform X2 n=1 Tax=Anthonomus grandis grandis TaxID=2921223 RepID=UPI002166188C|nr:fasciclin-2-like isoform X2 [Anthonomus grandis grandis]
MESTGVIICFVFMAFLLGISADSASLKILPNTRPLTRQAGDKLVLTCSPSNVERPELVNNFQWLDKRGHRIENTRSHDPIFIQEAKVDKSLRLVFNRITEQQEGTYTCKADYAGTELIETVDVSVYVDIEFVDAPENQLPKAGTNFLVKCIVKGNPSPTLEWYRGEHSIENNPNKYVKKNDGLYIINVSEADDGVYKCSAYVSLTGVFKEKNIKVEVQIPPNITLSTNETTVVEGEVSTVKCSANGKPPPSYQWIKLDRRYDLSKTDRFSVNARTGDLTITRPEATDDGMYQCVAENSAGRATMDIKVNVLVKPRIYELLNATAPVGNETRLVCKVRGKPLPMVTFRKVGSQLPFVVGQQPDDPRIRLEQETINADESAGVLIISELERPDDGLYECIAENKVGKSFKNGHITVWFKPTFNRTRDLPPVWTWDNRPGNLSCIPEAIPNATIVWKFRDVEISEENFRNNRISRNNFQVIGRGPRSNLIVTPHNDNGFFGKSYECIARNELGEASIFVELRKGEIPGPITQVKMAEITATSIRFSIIPPSNYEGLPIRSYVYQVRPDSEPAWDIFHYSRRQQWSFGAPYIVENLEPEVLYHFRFAARNDVGLGPFVNGPSMRMPRRSQPNAPLILTPNLNHTVDEIYVAPHANRFDLRWNVPADNGEPIDYYLIRYCKIAQTAQEEHEYDCTDNIQQSVQYTNYHLTDLYPETLYKVELRAHNAISESEATVLRFRTARGEPPVPIQAARMSSSTIVGISIAVVLIILILVDVACCLVNKTGLIALVKERISKKKSAEDPGFEIREEEPLNEEKRLTAEFKGRQVITRTGEVIGKHSAV